MILKYQPSSAQSTTLYDCSYDGRLLVNFYEEDSFGRSPGHFPGFDIRYAKCHIAYTSIFSDKNISPGKTRIVIILTHDSYLFF